jgi:hypothetical protein
MSEDNPQPETHRVNLHAHTQAVASARATFIAVTLPQQLAPALAQRQRAVIIENAEMQRRFTAFVQWQQAARWWLIPILIAWLLNQAIIRDYKIDASWRYIWKVERTFEGKITLTPTDPHPPREKPLPSEIPD